MKKHYISLIFSFLILSFLSSLFVSQLTTAYAATNPLILKLCKTNKDCASATSTADLICDPISNTCQNPQKKGGNCIGTGTDSTCANGLVCAVVQSTCKSIVVPGGKNAQSCQTTCQTPSAKQPPSSVGSGGKCTGAPGYQDNCSAGLACIKSVCGPQNGQQGDGCYPSDSRGYQDIPKNDYWAGILGYLHCASGLSCQGNGLGGYSGGTSTAKCEPITSPSLPPPPSPPCGTWSPNGQCLQFATAFGAISTSPAGFVRTIFAILLSVAGGIALLLIIRAGYQLITSQGKPEQIQNGRDQLIAAIVGLVFLIFAFVFLQLIGFDILRVPGFGQ